MYKQNVTDQENKEYELKSNCRDNHPQTESNTQSNTFIYSTHSLCRGCSYESEWKRGSEIDFFLHRAGDWEWLGWPFWKSFCTVVFYTIYWQSQMLVWEHYYWDQYHWYDWTACVWVLHRILPIEERGTNHASP